jgi:tryptophan synthase alpha chain
VGFGISGPDHARAAGSVADGVIVGSRLVAAVESAPSRAAAAADLRRLMREMRQALEESTGDE